MLLPSQLWSAARNMGVQKDKPEFAQLQLLVRVANKVAAGCDPSASPLPWYVFEYGFGGFYWIRLDATLGHYGLVDSAIEELMLELDELVPNATP